MIIESAAAPPFMKNGFVVSCERTRQAVYIDPGDEVQDLLAYIEQAQLEVTGILLTHAHVDHVSGVAAAKRALGAPIWLHPDDTFIYSRAVQQGRYVPLESVVRDALKRFPGQLLEVELDDGVYEVEILRSDGVVVELDYDARSGKLLKTELDD